MPPELKVAVLGSYSTQYISSCLQYALNYPAELMGSVKSPGAPKQIRAEVVDGEYDAMTLLDDESEFYSLKPDVVLLIPDVKDIYESRPQLLAEISDVDAAVESVAQYYANLWEKVQAKNVMLLDFAA